MSGTATPLTRRQQEVLRLISDYMDSHGFPPTRQEICRLLGFRSPNAAEEHLRALKRKGYIDILPGTSRGIVLNRLPSIHSGQLPLVGRVAAGTPILAEQNISEHYQLDPRLFSPRADYLLQVRGMSMIQAGICDGDLLAVHATPEARNGQIVVARLDDEVTVKRFSRHRQQIRLLPENEEFDPICVGPDRELVIEGLVVGIIRHKDLSAAPANARSRKQ